MKKKEYFEKLTFDLNYFFFVFSIDAAKEENVCMDMDMNSSS